MRRAANPQRSQISPMDSYKSFCADGALIPWKETFSVVSNASDHCYTLCTLEPSGWLLSQNETSTSAVRVIWILWNAAGLHLLCSTGMIKHTLKTVSLAMGHK